MKLKMKLKRDTFELENKMCRQFWADLPHNELPDPNTWERVKLEVNRKRDCEYEHVFPGEQWVRHKYIVAFICCGAYTIWQHKGHENWIQMDLLHFLWTEKQLWVVFFADLTSHITIFVCGMGSFWHVESLWQ